VTGLPSTVVVASGTATSGTITAVLLGNVTVRASSAVLTTADVSFLVVPVPTSTSLTLGASSVQYSDQLTLTATISPADLGNGQIVSGSVSFYANANLLGSASLVVTSGVASASISPAIQLSAANYTATAVFSSTNALFTGSTSADQTLTVNREATATSYTGDSCLFTAGPTITTASVVLSATLTQDADGYSGDITLARARFELYKSTNLAGAPDFVVGNVPVDAGGSAIATIALSADEWTVSVKIESTNGYWTANPIGIGLVTVALGSTDRRTTGGGWVADSASRNGKGNFGFTVNFQKNGSPKGNSIYVFRGFDGYNYIVKSNSWQGGGLSFYQDQTRAEFSGKCVVQKIDPATGALVASWGDCTYIVDLVDGDLLNPRDSDRYAITILDTGNNVWRQNGILTAPLVLGGGNIKVQSQ